MVDSGRVQLRPTDRVIDGAGQYLIPGLADMHSHAATPQDMARYLAYGVTTLRIMHGFSSHLAQRDAVAAGERIGPTLIVASPMMDGDPPAYPELVPVRLDGTHGLRQPDPNRHVFI